MANSISYGIGLVFGIVGLVLLLVRAVDTGTDVTAITSYSLYGVSMILLFLASTLYHAILHQKVGLNSPLAKGLMAVIWGLALLGVLFKLVFAYRFEMLSLVTYQTMGWLSLIVIYQLAMHLALGGVTLLAVGGAVYTLWVIFYASKRIRFCHIIWRHGFMLGGSSVCHFIAIYLYV
ncbi:hemolysin III family protein [Serratia symbiotica]|nr:hemolysin III family protein [Serratia symbiotica]